MPDMGTYVTSVDQLINSYIANVIKCPSSNLTAEDYHFNISYNEEGQVIMEGLIWPSCFRYKVLAAMLDCVVVLMFQSRLVKCHLH